MTDETSILVIEDERVLGEMLTLILRGDGHRVVYASTGEIGLESALREPPDLLLLDLNLPGMNGFEVLRALRQNPKTLHIPVIVLSARQDSRDKVAAFNLFAHDYLTKPFNSDELLARVRAHLHHASGSLLSPLTRLPSGPLIDSAIQQRLSAATPWAFLYLDLDHFKALNDAYGFNRGNEMILLLRRVVVEITAERGNHHDFVGHIGGEDFVVLTTPDHAQPLCQGIIQGFTTLSQRFYRAEDLERGAFYAQGRAGETRYFPLVTISIAVIFHTSDGGIRDIEHLSQVTARVKQRSKAVAGSCYVLDGDHQIYRVF